LAASAVAQPYYKQKPGANYHEAALEKWPTGKTEKKKDSGQYAVTSYFVDRPAKQWSLGLGSGATQFFGDAEKYNLAGMQQHLQNIASLKLLD